MEREEEIKLIAYRIWEDDGCHHGHAQEHWLNAEIIWLEKQPVQTGQPAEVNNVKPAPNTAKGVKSLNAGRKKS